MDVQQLLLAARQHLQDAQPLIPMYLHLIVSALFPIYAGAHASLSRPSSAAKPSKKQTRGSHGEDDDEEEEEVVQQMEGLSPRDALIFPVTAAIMLAFLYFLIKRYGAYMINLILGWYFSGVGVYSVGKLINDSLNFVISFLLPTFYARKGKLWKVDGNKKQAFALEDGKEVGEPSKAPTPLLIGPLKSFYDTVWYVRSVLKQRYATKLYLDNVVDFKAKLNLINFVSAFSGLAAILFANLVAKPWYLTNLQGFAVSYSAMQFMSPTTFATGSLILAGLFFYDIWAVFFTPLMVTVAKNLDQPIKLVFPRTEPSKIPGEAPVKGFSMLGLGDIVLPGIMIGLALRFDLHMHYLRKQKRTSATDKDAKDNVIEKAPYVAATGNYGDRFWTSGLPTSVRPEKLNASFPKPYFHAAMAGYVVGMLTTLGVMSVFQHAQPALLYLVPGVLVALWSTAVVRGELKEMWNFSEAITGEQVDEDVKVAEKKKAEKDDRSLTQKLWEEIFGSSAETSKVDEKVQTEGHKLKEKEANAKHTGTIVSFSVVRCTPLETSEARHEAVGSESEGGAATTTTSSKTQAPLVSR